MTKKRLLVQGTRLGIERAKKALLRLGFGTKANFVKVKYLSRTTVTNFFQLKPIQFDKFKDICEKLELNWNEIIDLSEEGDLELGQPKYRLKQTNPCSDNADSYDEDLFIQQPKELVIRSSKNVLLHISLDSLESIRATLQMYNQKAVSGLMPFNQDELTKIVAEFPQLAFRYSEDFIVKHDIDAGNKLYNLTLSQPVRQALEKLEFSVIELIVEPELQCLPWELMHNGVYFLSLKHDICRRVTSENDSRKLEKVAETSDNKIRKTNKTVKRFLFPDSDKLRFLMILGEDSHGNVEADMVRQLFIEYRQDTNWMVLYGAKRHEVLNQLYSGQDIIHFMSHAATDGIPLSDGILDINMIREAVSQHSTNLVILSACETGLSKSSGYQLALDGINVLCTLTWISPNLGQTITSAFYKNVLAGKSFSESLRLAKNDVYPMLGWWGFILYGNPLESLISIEAARDNNPVTR